MKPTAKAFNAGGLKHRLRDLLQPYPSICTCQVFGHPVAGGTGMQMRNGWAWGIWGPPPLLGGARVAGTVVTFTVVVHSLSPVWLFATPWTAACQASLSFTISWSFFKLMSTELVMPSNHLVLCHPLLLLPSVFSSIRVFSSELILCIMWPKYWTFSFSISPSNEHSGLISLRIDWFDLLAVQGTLKSLLQHHNLKASILKFLWRLTWVLKVGLFPQPFLHSHRGPLTFAFQPSFHRVG